MPVEFTATIEKFADQGEKTGWSYIRIPAAISDKLNPGCKKSYRVKGKLDEYAIKQIALLPMGEGDFIMALNAAIRKGIGKKKGAKLKVSLQVDKAEMKLPAEMLDCLADEPVALETFNKLPKSHQHYYGKWIMGAKTDQTRARRITLMIKALVQGMSFSEMMRSAKQDREDLSGNLRG